MCDEGFEVVLDYIHRNVQYMECHGIYNGPKVLFVNDGMFSFKLLCYFACVIQ